MARATTLNNNNREQTFTLERPGRFVGGSGATDSNSNAIQGIQLRTPTGDYLDYGESITQIRLAILNNSGATQEVGGHAIVFLRK